MIDLYNIAKLFLGCKLGEDCTMAWHNKLGEYGEEKVNRYLLDMGYTVLERNWRVGHRELDFVCLDGEVLVVVEVKTRADDNVSLFDLLDYMVSAHRGRYEGKADCHSVYCIFLDGWLCIL